VTRLGFKAGKAKEKKKIDKKKYDIKYEKQ